MEETKFHIDPILKNKRGGWINSETESEVIFKKKETEVILPICYVPTLAKMTESNTTPFGT